MGEQNTAEEKINRASGSPGQVKTSQGPNLPPIWGGTSCSQMYITTPAPTTIVAAGTYYKVAGTTEVYQLVNFTHSTGRLTYIGELTGKFDVVVPFSILSNAKDIEVTFQIYKNGGEGGIVASRIKRTLRAVGDIYVMSLASIVELAKNDYIELWATADVNGVIITVQTMSFLICS